MNHHLVVLPLLLASSTLQPGTGFALVSTSTCKFKHATSNPTAYYSRGELGTRRPIAGAATGAAASAATVIRAPWKHEATPYNTQHRLQVLSMSATEAEVSDVAFEPEISPGRALAEHEPRVQAFEAWAERAGCRGANSGSKLLHADFDGLRGLMTEGAVKPWQAVATVPASLFLEEFDSADTAVASTSLPPPEPISPKAWQQCPWWVRLGVRLLIEESAGEESRLHDYIGILPSQGETGAPINWSAEQLDRLHYPRLLSQIKLQRRLFNGYRKFLSADATRGNKAKNSQESDSSLVEALADPDTFNWCLECVLSRAFQLPPDDAAPFVFDEDDDVPVKAPAVEPPPPEAARMALLPFIDSMNHYSRMPTHMHWEADGAISLAVGAPLDPGDHVFLSYGPVSNDDLLQYYGFVEQDNPSDTYVLQDMGKWLREDGLLGADLTARLLSCPGAREVWRYLRRGVILRDAIHPSTMQAVRVVCCEGSTAPVTPNGTDGDTPLRWDGTEADLPRFSEPVSLASEIASFELIMRYGAREADAWGEAGVAAALAEDPAAPGLDGDLDGLGLDTDRRLMLSVFRQEKLALLRGIVSRLTHMRKVSDLLNRPIKMPAARSPPPVLGAPMFRASSRTGSS